ncbi:MAG: TonB-dependent receptor [Deltaproteobacteria bacterium]|nr:TonB-dependent receptor [Deltaproteobacteria bacterium]MBW2100939.1 TonB-dependent receptor [Deltaproteobacteria bacterium]
MKKWFFLCLGVAVLVLPGFCQAKEDKNSQEPVVAMEEMVVTAGRIQEKKKEITTHVTIIDKEQIKMSSAQDLGDLLGEKAGLYIRKYPGTLTTVGIRGFRTETHGNDLMGYVLILINGRRAGTGNLAKIMTKNIERIEIVRGPAAVQYGSAALGGVVNVITKQGKDKPEAFVDAKLGSFGYEEGNAGFSGRAGVFDFSGSFGRSSMDDYDTGDGKKFHNTGYDSKINGSLNLGLEILPGNRVGIIYTYFDADEVGNSNYLSANDLDDHKDTSNKSVDFIYEGRTQSGQFSWNAKYFTGDDKDKWVNPAGSDPDGFDLWYPSSKMETESEGAQGQVSLNLDIATVTAGFDWVNYDIEATWSPEKTEYDNTAGFVLAKTRLLDQRLILSGGLRYDEFDVEMKEPKGRDEDQDNWSPTFGAAYLVNDFVKIRANYAEAFKMPSAKELAADFFSWGTHYIGNPDLDPETSKTYEGGIDFSYAFFNSSLTYFYTDFEEKIESATTAGGDSTWENIGDATMSGFEGEFSYDIGPLFSWDFQIKPYAAFTYLTEYEDEDEETDEDLQYTSDITLSYGITVSDFNGFFANLNFAYLGEQDITDYEGGTYQVIKKGGFTVANLTVSKKIADSEKYGGLTLRGEIQNLFEKDYEYVQGYPMPGRSFFLGLSYDY